MTADPGRAALAPPAITRAGAPPRRLARARAIVSPARRWVSARGTATLTIIASCLAAVAVLVVRDPFALLPSRSASAAMPISAGMEARWGVRFTQIGTTADGGMVDVRYVVLDVDKAAALGSSPQDTPVLVEEGSKRIIFAVAIKSHAHDLHAGGRYYLLYRNTRGLLRAGSHVTITLAGNRLEHVTVLGTRAR